MSKIIYLLGAGASYGERDSSKNGMGYYVSGMPIVSEIEDYLNRYCSTFYPHISFMDGRNHIKYPAVYKELTWLRDVAKNNSTVDTYAKKLSQTGDTDGLRRLKRALAIFFSLIQCYEKRDKRYENFMGNVADNLGRINSNISVLSWNYDRQFEYALHDFELSKTSPTHQLKYSNITCKNLTTSFFNPRESNIVKLNGTASFKSIEDNYLFQEKDYAIDVFERLLSRKETKWVDGISYAWEVDEDFINRILPLTNDTEVLVIIGYSLPIANARIDKRIIDAMHNLKSVVIQDKNCQLVVNRFLELLSDDNKRQLDGDIKLINDVDSFYIPVSLLL